MSQVSIRINGRAYDVNCENGQEQHVQRLAMSLAGKVAELVKQVGQVGDARLLVMAGLLVQDELLDGQVRENALVKQVAELNKQVADKEAELQVAQRARQAAEASLTREGEEVSNRLDAIARRLVAS
ncbi:MAG: cell division protein ZapA [Rhodospirillales bacterium]